MQFGQVWESGFRVWVLSGFSSERVDICVLLRVEFYPLPSLFTLPSFTFQFTSSSYDVTYDVSTFISYTFRTFAVIFIVWPSFIVWPLSMYIDALMYDVFYL